MLSLIVNTAMAHQVWLERDAQGAVRAYIGEAEIGPDSGDLVARLAPGTRVFTNDPATTGKIEVKEDHLAVTSVGSGDVRLINHGVFKPWETSDGEWKTAILNAREGRADTSEKLDFEFVPLAAGSSVFALQFKNELLGEHEVTVINPERWTKIFKTNAEGQVEIPFEDTGRYIISATYTADETMKVADKPITGVDYTTTLSFYNP